MSRLEKHRQKRIIIYTTILLFVVIFLIFFGLPLLINGSVFFSNLFGESNDSSVNNSQTLRDLEISDVPVATNSSSFIVSGNLSNFEALEFYLNGEKVKSEKVKGKRDFSEEISGLKSGDNSFYILAKTTRLSDKKQTPTINVVYKDAKPKLEISEPVDNLKTAHSEIKVAGNTDKDVEVKINDAPVVVDAAGNFQTQVKLNNGENKINIVVIDSADNREEINLTVNYSSDN